MATRKLKVGLLGCGTVGGGLVELINKNSSLIRQRAGVELSITKILVRDPVKERSVSVDRGLLTTSAEKVINNGCDLVVELVGGIDAARGFIQRSLAGNKHVVTANKALSVFCFIVIIVKIVHFPALSIIACFIQEPSTLDSRHSTPFPPSTLHFLI